MRSKYAWRALCGIITVLLVLGLVAPLGAVAPAAASGTATGASQDVSIAQLNPGEYNTLRIYGRDNEGAGDRLEPARDPRTGVLPEDAPYTDLYSIFDPQENQAPRKDFITWNPIWMSELHTPDENRQLYQQIFMGGNNGAEKVHFRLWYEPRHMFKDINVDGVISETVDVVRPALMQEFTYQLTDLSYEPEMVGRRLPHPAYGNAGSTQFVFPMAIRYGDLFDGNGQVDTTSANAQYGYGLTSLDANFDGTPEIVQVHSEDSLARLLGFPLAQWLDFDGDNVRDTLDTDATQLSGDELAVFTLAPRRLSVGQSIMFLDYLVTLSAVGDADAVLRVRYVGDKVPDEPAHSHTLPAGAIRFIDRHGSETSAPNMGVVPVSPFFIQLVTVDSARNAVVIRIGRGLGAPYSAMESAVNQPDLEPGDPWFLKRFYVDGHEYDVVAIGTEGTDGFRFITIRTPVPKAEVYIAQHSVTLQDYQPLDWMSVMPPFNYEHYIFTDIQALSRFPDESVPPARNTMPWDIEPLIDYVGRLVGPVAPILQRNGPFPYYGSNPNVAYGDPREMFLFYVEEDVYRPFLGELKERYGEVVTPTLAGYPITEFWYDNQWWTQPWYYTEMVLPDISSQRTGASDPDLYLLTSAWRADQSEMLQWTQDAGQVEPRMYNLIWDPVRETWVHQQEAPEGRVPRVQFWFDPYQGGKKYHDQSGVRLYGRLNEGPGLRTAQDPENPTYPVEVWPYSDPWAPFSSDLPESPPKDSLTFNPVYMSRSNSSADPLRGLYGQISIRGTDAREKAFLRMWYEPQYWDKIRVTNTQIYSFPAVMQEFTYMFLDNNDRPTSGRVGQSNFVFPMATAADQLPRPDPTTYWQLPPGRLPSFGYGVTTFDANFDGTPDIVRVHSEYSLNALLSTVQLDFDGNNTNPGDFLDPDMAAAGMSGQPLMTGDEMVVFSVQNITLGLGQSAQFLDYMVTLNGVASMPGNPAAQAQLQVWYTGGGLHPQPGGGYSLHPVAIPALGSTTDLEAGDAAVAGRTRNHVRRIPRGSDNRGALDGPWFVYVHSVNRTSQTATVSIGRALGATYSAIDDGAGRHDLLPGDPWYLKRYFVDGHEYNVVAIRAEYNGATPTGQDPTEFKYITIRTPVPKVNFINQQDSQKLEGYFQGRVLGVDTDVISMLPPFNYRRSIAEDITTLQPERFAIPYYYDSDCAGLSTPARVVDPLTIRIVAEDRETQFFGELKQILEPERRLVWETQQFNTLPDRFTEFRLPAGELYLVTSNWRSDESIAHFYGCPLPPINPATPDNPTIIWNQQNELAALRASDPFLTIPFSNSVAAIPGGFWPPVPAPPQPPTNIYLAGYYDGLFKANPYPAWEESLRMKFWHDPTGVRDIYVNRVTLTPSEQCIELRQGWNLISFNIFPFNPAIGAVLSGLTGMYTRVLAFDCQAGTPGLSYYPDLPFLSNLQQMDPFHGYWIHMTSNATLCVRGVKMPATTPIYLCQGWNLVSYLPDTPMAVADALASIAGQYSVVLGWDNGALSYYPDLPPELNSLHQLEPGRGYWIKMNVPATLVYPESVMAAAALRPNVLSNFVPPSNLFANFVALNARFAGKPIPVGATVRAYDPDGVLCGEIVVAFPGGFLMPVYGDDPDTKNVDEGAKPGDVITFKINYQEYSDIPATTLPRAPIWTRVMDRVDITLNPLTMMLPVILH